MRPLIQSVPVLVGAAFVVALGGGTAQADYLNTFDTSASPFRFDYGTAASSTSLEFDADQNFGGPAGSGSAQFTQTFTAPDTSAAFTADIFAATTPVFGISFDLRVDPASVSGANNRGGGYFQVFTRQTDGYNPQVEVYNENLGNPSFAATTNYGEWVHVELTLDPLTTGANVRALTIQDYNNDNLSGTVIYNIDNLIITTTDPVPEPASLGLIGVAAAALLARRRA